MGIVTVISSKSLVALYRILSDYKAVAGIVSFGSIGAIALALIRLPTIPAPSLESLHSPAISMRRARRLLYFSGILAVLTILVTIVFHFAIPSDIGRPTGPVSIDPFRPPLLRFGISFVIAVLFQLFYWVLHAQHARALKSAEDQQK